jgi:heat shock protein HslJ
MKTFLFFVLVMMLVSGCGETEHIDTEREQVPDAPLLDTRWNLAEIDGAPIEVPDSSLPYLVFEADRVIGSDGCNSFLGSYIISGNTLTFVDLEGTLVYCLDTEVMELAYLFNTTLVKTNRYQIDENQLVPTKNIVHIDFVDFFATTIVRSLHENYNPLRPVHSTRPTPKPHPPAPRNSSAPPTAGLG